MMNSIRVKIQISPELIYKEKYIKESQKTIRKNCMMGIETRAHK